MCLDLQHVCRSVRTSRARWIIISSSWRVKSGNTTDAWDTEMATKTLLDIGSWAERSNQSIIWQSIGKHNIAPSIGQRFSTKTGMKFQNSLVGSK